jgi:hypothetical protein
MVAVQYPSDWLQDSSTLSMVVQAAASSCLTIQ